MCRFAQSVYGASKTVPSDPLSISKATAAMEENKDKSDDLRAKIVALGNTILPEFRKRMSPEREIQKQPDPKKPE